MPHPVSEDYVRALYSGGGAEVALLVTINADGLGEPLRACSWSEAIPGTNRQGLVSRGNTYPFLPFTFTWSGAGSGEISRAAKLEMANLDGAISEAVRTATGRPVVDVESVRVDHPDEVEMGMLEAGLSDVEIDKTHASGTLLGRDFANEPACGRFYTPSRTPAVF